MQFFGPDQGKYFTFLHAKQVNIQYTGNNFSLKKIPVFRAEHVGINIKGIVLATATVTVRPVSRSPVAGVKGSSNGVLVGLQGVILWAPLSTNKVGIAVVVSTITTVGARHADEVASSIAVTSNTKISLFWYYSLFFHL